MRIVHTVVIVLFAAAVIVFCVQNLHSVSISYLGWSVNVPLPLLVLLVYVLGMVTGWSVLSFLRRSFEGARRKAEKPA